MTKELDNSILTKYNLSASVAQLKINIQASTHGVKDSPANLHIYWFTKNYNKPQFN